MISDADLTELTAALDAVLEKGPDGFDEGEPQPVFTPSGDQEKPVWQIVNIWEATPAFERLYLPPRTW